MASKISALLTLIALAAGLSSQASLAVETPPALTATSWSWQQTQMNNDDRFRPAEPGNYHLRFLGDGTLAIQADCNRAQGRYEIEEHRLRIELGPTTLMACGEASLGDRFLANLGGANSYFLRDGNLFIELKFDSGTMTFSPQAPGLVGTRWRVTGVNNGRGALEGVLGDPELYLDFGEGGALDGSAGCNHFSASFTLSGDQITISQAKSTRKFCQDPPGVMAQETAFLAALPQAARFERTGDRLELRMADGALAATFTRLPE